MILWVVVNMKKERKIKQNGSIQIRPMIFCQLVPPYRSQHPGRLPPGPAEAKEPDHGDDRAEHQQQVGT